ncbi:MAG: type I restriction enzyme HsdR N-terminal domain-containing protein [Candidatus Altiarchaeota archaeon]|nr:type I restriction enzyme HsdR N-terminal domain-containing protein [Candidatus Altiarchaeota archaeon]
MEKEFKKKLSAYASIFREAQEKGKKEADIVMYIVEFLKDALKYDVFKEISKEYQIKDKYCDIAIKIDGEVVMLIEAKQPGIKLHDRHIEQAENYAMRNGTEWAILTNGCEWRLYHLEVTDEGIDSNLAFRTDLLNSYDENPDDVLPKFLLLHRKNFIKGSLDKYWQKLNLLTPKSLLQAVFTDSVLKTIARELNRGENVRVGISELEREIKNVLDKNILAELADIKLKKKKKARRGGRKRKPSAKDAGRMIAAEKSEETGKGPEQ